MTTPNIGSQWMGNVPPWAPYSALVTNYGVVGDGITDDTLAINNMFSYLTGNSLATSGGRNVKAPIIFPPGTYLVTSDLLLPSTVQPVIMGYGAFIKASGANFTKALLNLDGCYKGKVAGLTLIGDGTEQVPSALKLDNSTAGYQATTGCVFEDIIIRNLKYVTGLDLAGTGNRQLDGTQVNNVLIAGGQNNTNWSNSGNYQNGVQMGNGTFANNYNHNLRGVSCSGHYYNYYCNASSLSMDGGQPANGFIDFNIFPGAECSIRNVQTQNCNQAFAVQGFSPNPVTFDDLVIKSNFINASGYVGTIVGGPVALRNVMWATCQIVSSGAYGNCLIHVTNDGSTSRYTTLLAENCCGDGLKTASIVPAAPTGNANIVCSNYMNYNPTTGNYTLAAGDILSYYTGTAWTTIA